MRFSSATKREVLCYLPGSFTSSGPVLHRNIAFIADLDSFSYWQNSKLLLKNICHTTPVANGISKTQFHLRKLNK